MIVFYINFLLTYASHGIIFNCILGFSVITEREMVFCHGDNQGKGMDCQVQTTELVIKQK
jgi:hypothetical protein